MIQFCITVVILAAILTFIFRNALEYIEDDEDNTTEANGKP